MTQNEKMLKIVRETLDAVDIKRLKAVRLSTSPSEIDGDELIVIDILLGEATKEPKAVDEGDYYDED